jgi:hypothetical protein
MKQLGIGEHIIETVIRQIEVQEILLPHFTAAVNACHRSEACGPSNPSAI